jgi:hypothetical protein
VATRKRATERGKICRIRGLLAIDRLLALKSTLKRSIGKMRGKLY